MLEVKNKKNILVKITSNKRTRVTFGKLFQEINRLRKVSQSNLISTIKFIKY